MRGRGSERERKVSLVGRIAFSIAQIVVHRREVLREFLYKTRTGMSGFENSFNFRQPAVKSGHACASVLRLQENSTYFGWKGFLRAHFRSLESRGSLGEAFGGSWGDL